MPSTRVPGKPGETADVQPQSHYEAPSVTYLGTLRELTQGGTTGPTDAIGGAGGAGSIQ
jgi:hypothetical protein